MPKLDDKDLIAAMDAGRERERRDVIVFLYQAIAEADDKMFRTTDQDARRNFAASSVAIQRLIILIEDSHHRGCAGD